MPERLWKIPITVMLTQGEVEEIDAERRGTPRSAYLRDIIVNRKKVK